MTGKGAVVSVLTLIMVLTAGAPASGSTAALFTDEGGRLSLVVTAGAGEANGFEIAKGDEFSSFPDRYRIRDRIPNSTNYNSIAPGDGCVADPVGPAPGVVCSPAGDLRISVATAEETDFVRLETGIGSGVNAALEVTADLGDGDDEFLDLDNDVPDTVAGDGGDDAISTFGDNDVIYGGPGADQHLRRESSNGDEGLVGGDGADEIFADDGGTRDLVDCGHQTDTAHVDDADVVTACETVVRPSGVVDPPVLGKQVNVATVSGEVLVALPGSAGAARRGRASQKGMTFVPLEEARQVPVGSFVDTRRGTVGLTSARNAKGATQSARVLAGVFQVLQSRRRAAKGLTELRLAGGSFRGCRSPGSRSEGSVAQRLSRRTVRRLRARAKGRFRTRGRHSAATVRGTAWDTVDRCDGTLTRVRRGRVVVRDFRRRKDVLLRAGKSYLARS